jgi:EAL domain-containing protein (putative c-di-GMP-specific phosphodiesterase class I)/GGDEF domain-containing protein
MPPVLDALTSGPAAPTRVLLQVGQAWRARLASALLDQGLQPVLPGEHGPAPADVLVQEFSRNCTAAPVPRTARQPMVAWLDSRTGDDLTSLRHRALDAGAVSLVQASDASEELTRVVRHLGRLHHAPATPTAPSAPAAKGRTSPLHAWLVEALAQANTRAHLGAVVLLTLERFDEVVLTLGADLGAALQQAIERRLQVALVAIEARHGGRLRARLAHGAEGLAVVITPLAQSGLALTVANELLQRLDDPIDLGDHRLMVGGHAGVALFPHDGHQAEVLLRNATLALHAARRQGRGSCIAYGPALSQGAMRRLQMEGGMRRALAQGGFELHFQPQADLHTGALTGAEALLRWNDRNLGPIEPTEFIPLAEDTGLITRIGNWVLKNTCQQIRRWHDQGLDVPRIAVNVSRLEIIQPEFVPNVLKTLEDHGLPGQALTLELTEPALMHDVERLGQRLKTLRASGVRIAIDDFGCGYSSLARLSRLPLDELKIDRSFLATLDGNGAKVAAAVIAMGHTLGLRVLAEGVEHTAQLEFLRRHGCDEFQGHLLAHPLEAATMGQVISHARIQHRLVMDSLPSPVTPPAMAFEIPPFPSLPTLPMLEAELAGTGRPRR